MSVKNISCFTFLWLLTVLFGAAKAQTLSDTTALSEVIVRANPIPNTIQKSAAAITVVSNAQINQSDGVILTTVLNKVAGVSMQQGALNTNRISMRGIGARSQFGTNRIKAYYENIPLSNAEGDTVLEDIDLESLERIEIIKGPNSTSFGAGLGGVIQLIGKTTKSNSAFGKIASTAGSFGLLKNSVSAGYNEGKTNVLMGYNQLQSDGFRENSAYDRKSFHLSLKQRLTERSSLSFFGIATKLKAFIPSSINETDFENNPEVAAANWKAAQGFESYDKLQMGVGYQNEISSKWSIDASVFSTLINANEPRPFNILDDATQNFGFRFQANYAEKLFSLPSKLCFGSEMLFENYSFSLFENLYLSQPNQGSVQGDLFAKNKQSRNYQNLFFQIELDVSQKLSLESGIALNQTHYKQNDDFEPTTTGLSDYSFDAILLPRIGISYEVVQNKNIYASISKGFSVPSVEESLTPAGIINTELRPEIGVNYEIGFKGWFWNQKLYSEITAYSTDVKNLLVARRVTEDQFIGINAGSSLHQGIELLLKLKVIEKDSYQINTFFSGTYTHIRFREFIELENDYSGNKLSAVPQKQWNLGLDCNTKLGLNAAISLGQVGAMALNDANTLSSDAYELLDAKVSYSILLFKQLKVQSHLGIQNALNQKYAASVLPNAVGFGANLPRYFYPGNPINYYGGVGLVFQIK